MLTALLLALAIIVGVSLYVGAAFFFYGLFTGLGDKEWADELMIAYVAWPIVMPIIGVVVLIMSFCEWLHDTGNRLGGG